MNAFPVYVGLNKFYAYPVEYSCQPNHKACPRCMCFGGYIDENHFLCSQYWQKKVMKTTNKEDKQ